MKERVGFIGVGHMGTPLVERMIRSGFDVTLYDIRPEAVMAFAKRNIAVAESLEQLTAASDIIATCLLNDEDVAKLLFGKTGLLSAMSDKQLLMAHSTISIDISERIGAEAARLGIGFVDAPVSGGQKERDDGTMTVFVGGTERDYLRARPVLESFGRMVVHMGPNGSGSIGKIANNLMQLSNTITAIEAMRLAKAYGIPEEKMVELSSMSSGNSWSLNNLDFFDDFLANHQLSGDPDALLDYLAKDIGLAAAAAERKGIDLSIARSNQILARDIFARRKAQH